MDMVGASLPLQLLIVSYSQLRVREHRPRGLHLLEPFGRLRLLRAVRLRVLVGVPTQRGAAVRLAQLVDARASGGLEDGVEARLGLGIGIGLGIGLGIGIG